MSVGEAPGIARCIVCGRLGPFSPHYAVDGYRLVRCPGCSLVFQDPQPSDRVLDECYYHDPGFTADLFGPLRAWTLAQAHEHADAFQRLSPMTPGRLLDVGCSSGAFLETAAARGWQVTGAELGAATAAAARRRGLDVRTGTLAAAGADLPAGTFHLVTFWDVLEHVRNPHDELAHACRLLAPGGRVAISCPNIAGLYPRLSYRLAARPLGVWEHPELPAHLYDFSLSTLTRLLQHHDLRVVGHRTSNIPFAALRSTTLAPGRWGGGRRERVATALLDGLHRAVYPLAASTDQGNSLVVVAERVGPGRARPAREATGRAPAGQ